MTPRMHHASREQALAAVRAFHAEHGRLPRWREWEQATASRPCARTIERRWGWGELLAEAIGVEPSDVGDRWELVRDDRAQQMLAELRAARDVLGRWPTRAEWEASVRRPSARAFVRHFGGWRLARVAAESSKEMPMRRGWDDDETARRYDEHTQRHPGYRERAERLVALAGIEPGMHVVDLACGTGVTTAAILRRLDGSGRVTAVDGAEALLAVARERLAGAGVTWMHARGEALDAAVAEPADAVLCSAAFWQMRWPEAMAAVRNTLRVGGVFAFNLPRQFFPALFPERPPHSGPSLGDRIMAVAKQEHGLVPPDAQPAPPRPGSDLDSLRSLLGETGLRLDRWGRFDQQLSTEEAVSWLRVPVFTTRLLPGLDYATRMAILDAALDGYQPTETETSDWAQFRCLRK